jgi:succinoglycan biosynthesis transport protein ExoP
MASVDAPLGAPAPTDRSVAGAIPARVPYQDDALQNGAMEDDAEPAIDLRAMWSTIFRHRYMMIAIVGIALLLGIGSALLMPRKYTAVSSIQIDQQVAKVLGTEDSEPQVAGSDADRFLQTQVDVLNSRAIARRVSESLGLAANDSFLKRMTGARSVEIKPGDGSLSDIVVDVLQKNLTVDLRRNSRVVHIIFVSRDPALAAEIANSYASNFIEGNIQRKFSASSYSRRFLQNQLGLAKGRLEGSERQLIAYARDARLIDASAGARQAEGDNGPRSLVTSNLVQLNADSATAESNRLRTRERWEQARSSPLMSLPEVQANEAVQRLNQKRAEDIANLSEVRRRLKPDHPVVIQAVAEIATLDQQIRQLAEETRRSIQNQYLTAERQHAALTQQVVSLQGATLAEQGRSVRYNILRREVDTNRQLYESLLQRFKEVSAESGITSNNVTSVDTAEQPRRPTSPRPLLNVALGLILGVVLAMFYAFGRDYLDDSIRDPQDVEEKLRIPLLGVVPDSKGVVPAEALDDPKSEIAEAYHAIRTSIELSSNQGPPRSILVTGSSKSEGKSTTSFALARDFAGLGRRVLLVDADLRRPSLHRALGIALPDTGLSSVLARMTERSAAILPTGIGGLSFLPSGRLPPDPATLFAGSAMRDLLTALESDYDVVIVDGPPVLALADAAQLTAAVQATVFVAEASGARFGQARNAVSRLLRAGGNVIGCVMTKYNAKKAGYGQSYDYYRYRYDDTSK